MGQRASSEPDPNDPNPEVAWWCKLLARVIGTVGAIIALCLGVWTCVSVTPLCIVAGLIQMLVAGLVLIFEAPCCCTWFDLTKPIATFAEGRAFWHKAAIYGVLSIIPIAMCFGVSTLFGAGLIFASAVFYGLMALGKKADRSTMLARSGRDDVKLDLVQNDDLQAAQGH